MQFNKLHSLKKLINLFCVLILINAVFFSLTAEKVAAQTEIPSDVSVTAENYENVNEQYSIYYVNDGSTIPNNYWYIIVYTDSTGNISGSIVIDSNLKPLLFEDINSKDMFYVPASAYHYNLDNSQDIETFYLNEASEADALKTAALNDKEQLDSNLPELYLIGAVEALFYTGSLIAGTFLPGAPLYFSIVSGFSDVCDSFQEAETLASIFKIKEYLEHVSLTYLDLANLYEYQSTLYLEASSGSYKNIKLIIPGPGSYDEITTSKYEQVLGYLYNIAELGNHQDLMSDLLLQINAMESSKNVGRYVIRPQIEGYYNDLVSNYRYTNAADEMASTEGFDVYPTSAAVGYSNTNLLIIDFMNDNVTTGTPLQWFIVKPDGEVIIGEIDSFKCCFVGALYDEAYYDFPVEGTYTIKVNVDNSYNVSWDVYAISDVAPPTGNVRVNLGNEYTTSTSVSLTLSASDLSGVTEMQFSNDGTSWSSPETFSTTKSWTLTSGDGTKKVFAKFKDGLDHWTVTPVQDTIILDTLPPIISNLQTGGITRNTAMIYWDTDESSNSVVQFGTTSNYGDSISESYAVNKHVISLTGLSPGKTYHFRVKSTDERGFTAVGSDYTFNTVNILPTAEIISISRNSTIQGQPVSFSGSGTDTDGTIIGWNWSSSIDGLLNTSSSFISSTLSVGDHTIYFKVKDNNNAWSDEVSQILTIDPDVTPPTIIINSPLNNTVVGEYTLYISGVAYDISGVSQVLINGNPVSTDYSAPGDVSFNTSIQLRIGDNEIIVTAIDSYNNSGDKTLNVKLIRGAIVEDPGTTTTTWTVENFGGFHYDIDDDTGTEMLMINPTASISGDSAGLNVGYRTIDERELSYSTNAVTKYCEYGFFGSYNSINFMAEPYLSLLEGEGLSKVLIDSDDTYTVTTGDGIELQEGYVLNVLQVDIDGNKAYIELTKNGIVVDTEIVSLEMMSPQVYVYNELSIGGEANVLTIMAGVKSVFRGTETDIVIIEGIFQISDTLTSVRIGDTYGNMEVTDNSAIHITMKNLVPVDLIQGSTVDIMGDIKFRVADDGSVLRFHPMLEMTEPRTYEIRGAVVGDTDAVGIEWNPVNFAGFYYDLDEDIGTEKLLINSSYYRTIDQNELIYSTSSQDKQFAYGNFGHYNVIGFMSDLYFVGYDAVAQNIGAPIIDASQNGPGILAINFLSSQNISKILIDTDEMYAVISGEGLELQEGYVLNVSSIDMVNNDTILQLSKDGTVMDTKTVPSGGVYVYDELNLGAEANVPTIIALVGTIFSGTDTDAVTFESLFQISDTLTSVELGNTYGIMEITDMTASTIVMENANSITLSRGSIEEIMGDIKFRIADADILRFYPMADYRIESPIYDIVLPTLTITTPVNDTIVYTSSITITGTASDDTSIASIAVNGILAAGTTSWGVNVPLTEGESTINVVATDIAGNTATATINVTCTIAGLVEIRGSVVEDPGTVTTTWTAENFGGFHYDIDADIGSEGLMINPTASISGNTAGLNSGYRTIDNHELSYYTGIFTKDFEYGFFGNYNAINFMAEQYLTLHAGSADGGLLKILIDSDDTYIVNTGDGIELKEGYVLNVRQVDIDGGKVLLELTKYGNVVDTEIVSLEMMSPQVYVYNELSIGDETNVPTIMVGVKSVFRGTDTDMVTIEGIFQISDKLTSVGIDDTYGNMGVVVLGPVIVMNNQVPINLSQGSTVDIMGDMKFRVADDDTVLRFYPMLEKTEPGTHEIRGEIVQAPDTGIAWNPVNFAGFYYDIDENIGTETLTINSSYPLSSIDRTIDQNELIYSTSTQGKQFAYENFGHYTHIGFMAKPYFAGYNAALRDLDMSIINASQNGTDILDINFFEDKNLSRILIDTDEAYTVVSGDELELQEGYVLNVSSIDILNNNTIIKLSKNGTIVDTKTVSSGDVYVYDELDIGGENNVPTIIVRIDTVLTDTGTDMVLFKGLFQISDSLTSVDVGDTYGNMKITSNNATSIVMRNNWRISLNKGSIKEIMGDIKFRVADADNLRFYPFVDAIIEDITSNFNTTTFIIDTTPPVINIISPQNGTTLVTPAVTIAGTISDASDVALVTVNGETATGTTNWSADVTLIDGENNITIVVTDDLGNTQSVVLTVYYNPSAVIISMGLAKVPSNSLVTIPVSIANATNITGISFDLFYNASVVSVDSIVANNSFTSSSVSSNVDNINGTTRVVLTNTNLISSSTQTPVIDVTFNVTGDFGSLTNLDLENVELSNSDFNPDTPVSVVDGLITVGINGDLNDNGYVDIGDVAKVAFMVAGKVPEELSADFNDNGYVDIGDAAKIAFYLAGKVSEL